MNPIVGWDFMYPNKHISALYWPYSCWHRTHGLVPVWYTHVRRGCIVSWGLRVLRLCIGLLLLTFCFSIEARVSVVTGGFIRALAGPALAHNLVRRLIWSSRVVSWRADSEWSIASLLFSDTPSFFRLCMCGPSSRRLLIACIIITFALRRIRICHPGR